MLKTAQLFRLGLLSSMICGLGACLGATQTPGTAPPSGSVDDGNPTPVQPIVPDLVPVTPATIGTAYDVVGFISLGSDRAVGRGANATWTDGESYARAYKLADYGNTFANAADVPHSLYAAALSEPLRALAGAGSGAYPGNLYGITGHSAFAEQLNLLSLAQRNRGYPSAHSAVGRMGANMVQLGKSYASSATNTPYDAALYETQAFASIFARQQQKYAVGAVFLHHGETDAFSRSYGESLTGLQRDMQSDVRAITGQTHPVPLLYFQQNSRGAGKDVASLRDGNSFSWSSYAAWRTALDNPETLLLVGPSYPQTYSYGTDSLLQAGLRTLAEKAAQVYAQVVESNKAWLPTAALHVQQQDDTHLRVSFHVPQPPLTWAQPIPALLNRHSSGPWAAWANGRGFEAISDTGAPLTIQSVALEPDGRAVLLTMAAPVQPGTTVQYALTQDQNSNVAASTDGGGYSGDLMDSDKFVGRSSNRAHCLLAQNNDTISCQSSIWAANLYGNVVDSGGNVLATVINPIDADRWKTWRLTQSWTAPDRLAQVSFRNRYENYAVAFMLPVLWQALSAQRPLPNDGWQTGNTSQGAASGTCLAQIGGGQLVGTFDAQTQRCTVAPIDKAAETIVTDVFWLLQQPGRSWVWQAQKDGQSIPNAVLAGTYAASPLYVCRAVQGGATVSGWLARSSTALSGCHVVADGKQVVAQTYEVLQTP